MPKLGYVVDDYEFDHLSEELALYLSDEDRKKYMQIVGSLLWITGVRLDIIFAVMYLTWFTKKPRVHHLKMALYVVNYLYYTKDVPLVMGGRDNVRIITYTDSSLGTGPKNRSVSGQMTRLGQYAGGVHGKSSSSQTVRLSSFESELDAATSAMKTVNRLGNILDEMGFKLREKPIVYSDNEAMINFVKGEGVAKGVRHMELRMWYTREQYKKGSLDLVYMPGIEIPSDKFTKLASRLEQRAFRHDVQGLGLLGELEDSTVGETK
jgi:hypothetical protein